MHESRQLCTADTYLQPVKSNLRYHRSVLANRCLPTQRARDSDGESERRCRTATTMQIHFRVLAKKTSGVMSIVVVTDKSSRYRFRTRAIKWNQPSDTEAVVSSAECRSPSGTDACRHCTDIAETQLRCLLFFAPQFHHSNNKQIRRSEVAPFY
ncbi:hypothetical protein PHSY_006287 [Pseudozyma hubeiensis SY62]|uniref:Uncharacterized protein n=1 Tax=Pseudozyma hubeiensis (strain SY62) TaxID=1305764 RepID=R9PBA7_PSEHS|nr:hypothetical protein PHSY_006287 [Pseudozyma hubeiensis SY62]GAC98693.1 hypothetical protein PHSY_006287 [Pseudozyma hubeiensis SY62]